VSAFVGIRRKELVLIRIRESVQPGMNEINCMQCGSQRECMRDRFTTEFFSATAVKLSQCYSVSYLYASNAATDKGADPLGGGPMSDPRH
jgi:hypothetical protein